MSDNSNVSGLGESQIEWFAASQAKPGKPRCGDCFTVLSSVEDRWTVVIVSDGVGTRASDRVASSTTCRVMAEFCGAHPDLEPGKRLAAAAERASQEVNQLSGAYAGAMATVVAMLWSPDEDAAWVLSVGDSRIYALRAGELVQISRDDKAAVPVTRDGTPVMGGGGIQTSKGITRAIGQSAALGVQAQPCGFMPGDTMILVSDGTYEAEGFESAMAILDRCGDLEGVAKSALFSRRQGRFGDDATAVVVRRRVGDATVLETIAKGMLEAPHDLPRYSPHVYLEVVMNVASDAVMARDVDRVRACVEYITIHDLHPSRAQVGRFYDQALDAGDPPGVAAVFRRLSSRVE